MRAGNIVWADLGITSQSRAEESGLYWIGTVGLHGFFVT